MSGPDDDDPGLHVHELGDGLWLRTANDDDVAGIVAVETAAFGAPDGAGIMGAIEQGGGPGDWAVVVDRSDRVVSASALLDLTVEVDGCAVPSGQIEWVATYPEHQRRGLVRAQFDRHHRVSAARGHLLTLITGIPYLYRRLGYGYGLDFPTIYLFDSDEFASTRTDDADQLDIRDATEADIPGMVALEATRASDGVRARRDERFWLRRLAATTGDRSRFERLVVAERAGEIAGWLTGKLDVDGEKRLHCKPGAAIDNPTADALIAHMLDRAAQDDVLLLADAAPGSTYGERIAQVGKPIELYAGYYTRTPDPVALLGTLQPVLNARLQASPKYRERAGRLEISLYNSGVAIEYEAGLVTAIEAIPGVEDPLEDFGVGVAPDWFAALVLGRWGARELAERVDDVALGRHRGIMATLFPQRPCDIAADL